MSIVYCIRLRSTAQPETWPNPHGRAGQNTYTHAITFRAGDGVSFHELRFQRLPPLLLLLINPGPAGTSPLPFRGQLSIIRAGYRAAPSLPGSASGAASTCHACPLQPRHATSTASPMESRYSGPNRGTAAAGYSLYTIGCPELVPPVPYTQHRRTPWHLSMGESGHGVPTFNMSGSNNTHTLWAPASI